jgi:hypothetical protein
LLTPGKISVCCVVVVLIAACGKLTTFNDMELYFSRHKDALMSAKDFFMSESDFDTDAGPDWPALTSEQVKGNTDIVHRLHLERVIKWTTSDKTVHIEFVLSSKRNAVALAEI